MMRAILVATFLMAGAFSGCAYLGTWAKQSYYRQQLRWTPRLETTKHLLDRETFYVFGQVLNHEDSANRPLAVLALSDDAAPSEIVDISHSVGGGMYYALNLPPGAYRLAAVVDADSDGTYTDKEVIAERSLGLGVARPERVLGQIDLNAGRSRGNTGSTFSARVSSAPAAQESVFYPKGSIRTLDDPLFSRGMASLGLYDPAAFMESAPMMFYALEEDHGHKVPVVFVHGIEGSAADFADILARLDRRRYRPWFFYYPSGGKLEQLSALFYEIFLSGRTIPRQVASMVIVAHSMGGLIARDALNHWSNQPSEASVSCLITLASPLGGHPSAARAANGPFIVPAWRDLDPHSGFIAGLFRNPLPAGLRYHLFYARGDPRLVRFGPPGDGVVPQYAQLPDAAVREATQQDALDCSHTGILHDPKAVDRIVRAIEFTKSPYPADHLQACDLGGYTCDLPPEHFSALETYLLRTYAHYFDALISGAIQPIDPIQAEFIAECRGQRRAETPASNAWLKFARLYPRSSDRH